MRTCEHYIIDCLFGCKGIRRLSLCLGVMLLVACNTTKFVPKGEYLLNDVKIKVKDTKDVPAADLMKYVQQKQNTEILGFWKLQLDIYNTASEDTTKWTSKNARKIGEAPVIFSPELAIHSCAQLTKAMNNKGYFQAQVDTAMTEKDRKLNLTYEIQANQPYYIRRYAVELPHEELVAIAQNKRQTLIEEGMQFDADLLNQERQRVASTMRRRGYNTAVLDADITGPSIPKAFGLEEAKGEIDYNRHNYLPPNSPLTEQEEEYIKHDVIIVAKALNFMFEHGMNKMTVGACALNGYKEMIGKHSFKRWFPTPDYHDDVKQSYRGGFTYLEPQFAGKIIKEGITLDVNSLYPSVMYEKLLPFGEPIFYDRKI